MQPRQSCGVRLDGNDAATTADPVGHEQRVGPGVGTDVKKDKIRRQPSLEQGYFDRIKKLRSCHQALFAGVASRIEPHAAAESDEINRSSRVALQDGADQGGSTPSSPSAWQLAADGHEPRLQRRWSVAAKGQTVFGTNRHSTKRCEVREPELAERIEHPFHRLPPNSSGVGCWSTILCRRGIELPALRLTRPIKVITHCARADRGQVCVGSAPFSGAWPLCQPIERPDAPGFAAAAWLRCITASGVGGQQNAGRPGSPLPSAASTVSIERGGPRPDGQRAAVGSGARKRGRPQDRKLMTALYRHAIAGNDPGIYNRIWLCLLP